MPQSPLASGNANCLSPAASGGPVPVPKSPVDEIMRAHRARKSIRAAPIRQKRTASQTKKRAVLVGPAYCNTLRLKNFKGSTDDISMLYNLLNLELGFKSEDIWVLTDEPRAVVGAAYRLVPTRENILNSMRWLVQNSCRGEELVFCFSGHGQKVITGEFDDEVQYDCILPTDYPSSESIKAEEIQEILVQGLADGATLTSLFNCRHSSQMMGLPYVHVPTKFGRRAFTLSEKLEEPDGFLILNPDAEPSNAWPFSKSRKERHEIRKKIAEIRREKQASSCFANGNVICISNIPESDGLPKPRSIENPLIGSIVRYLSHCVSEKEEVSYKSVLCAMSSWMVSRADFRLPQLSSSHPIRADGNISVLGQHR